MDEDFGFFTEASNLERITPPELRFHIVTPQPIRIAKGAEIDYRLCLLGVPFIWQTVISFWDAPYRLSDEQIRGPLSQLLYSLRIKSCIFQ